MIEVNANAYSKPDWWVYKAYSKPDWTEMIAYNGCEFELEFEPDTFSVSFDSKFVKSENFAEVLEFIAAKAKDAFALDETFEFPNVNVLPGDFKITLSAYSIYCKLRDLRLDHWEAVDLMQKPWGHRFPDKHLGTFPDADKIVNYFEEDPQEYTADAFVGEDRPLSAIVETPLGLQVFTNLRW